MLTQGSCLWVFVTDVTTRGSYLPDKSMASASVRPGPRPPPSDSLRELVLTLRQNPPLYLHVTSTTREGLEKAITKINELINSELPPLVDERRFRRREREEQSPSEREEFVRVCRAPCRFASSGVLLVLPFQQIFPANIFFRRKNGQKSEFPSTLSPSWGSISVRRWLAMEAPT